MNPYDHAQSSARVHGGVWQDYHPFHAFFDATKAAMCDFRHRALRHHREGAKAIRARFGAEFQNSDGSWVWTGDLARQHLLEDCEREPDAADWLVDYARPAWAPAVVTDAVELAVRSASRFGGTAEDHLPLHAWFLETASWSPGPEHLLFRHHAFGCFEAEERFGPVIEWDGGRVPTRVAAENHVRAVVGRVPPASAWLKGIQGRRWMLRAATQEVGLDAAA